MNKTSMTLILASVLVVTLIMVSYGDEWSSSDNEITEVYESLSPQARALYHQQSEGLTKPVPERLVELDQKIIGCFGPQRIMGMHEGSTNLGGQCCGALTDFEAYKVQLEALEEFRKHHDGGDIVPEDPYDIDVDKAKEFTSYHYDIDLEEDNKVYEEALEISHHGPCCCKCWKWYMMSGLAKKLIQDYGWSSEDIAEMWDLSSSCGHDEDTDIHEHYGHDH